MLPILLEALKSHYNSEQMEYTPVSGGDINQAFLLELDDAKYFIKVNTGQEAFGILQSEFESLLFYAEIKGLNVPHCETPISFGQGYWLAMEYIPPGRPTANSWTALADQLLLLHQKSSEKFGWKNSNFIGSLPQANQSHSDWASFYISQRLAPQLKLAFDQGYLSSEDHLLVDRFLKKIAELMPGIQPALLHGDFWNGNFLWNQQGIPYLIDPSTYFGHREIDLAMARLFGGFNPQFFSHYQNQWPLDPGHEERISIYQLYYILVHLNLFGNSYYAQAMSIINKFAARTN